MIKKIFIYVTGLLEERINSKILSRLKPDGEVIFDTEEVPKKWQNKDYIIINSQITRVSNNIIYHEAKARKGNKYDGCKGKKCIAKSCQLCRFRNKSYDEDKQLVLPKAATIIIYPCYKIDGVKAKKADTVLTDNGIRYIFNLAYYNDTYKAILGGLSLTIDINRKQGIAELSFSNRINYPSIDNSFSQCFSISNSNKWKSLIRIFDYISSLIDVKNLSSFDLSYFADFIEVREELLEHLNKLGINLYPAQPEQAESPITQITLTEERNRGKEGGYIFKLSSPDFAEEVLLSPKRDLKELAKEVNSLLSIIDKVITSKPLLSLDCDQFYCLKNILSYKHGLVNTLNDCRRWKKC